MIEAELPFKRSTAHKLMAISADERLSNVSHGKHLPPSWTKLYELTRLPDERIADRAHVHVLPPHWGTLYELTKLPNDKFAAKLASGEIHPEMLREDVGPFSFPRRGRLC
jgi:hypothetical protein